MILHERVFLLLVVQLLVAISDESVTITTSSSLLSSSYSSLYTAITDADTSDSLYRIKSSKLKYYEFKYDSVSGRKQLGYIGEDVHKYFPDALDIVSSHIIPSIDRTKPSTLLKNFPIVDKNIIFMHGLAALQELVSKLEYIENNIINVTTNNNNIKNMYNYIDIKLSSEIDKNFLERIKMLELEVEANRKASELLVIQNDREKKGLDKILNDEKALLDYQEVLAKNRLIRSEELARESMEKLLSMERQLAEKKEKTRQDTEVSMQKIKFEQEKLLLEKKTESEKSKITTEINAKAELERANEDISIRKLQAQAKMDTERMITGIKTFTDQIIRLIQSILFQPERLATIIGIFFSLYLTVYFIREMIQLIRQTIQSIIGRPKLVRETSCSFSIIPYFLTLSYWFIGKESLETGIKKVEDYFVDVILSDDDKDRVTKLALATRNTKSSKASYRHVLLHGPPGTGKTLIARRLAQCSGMDYAIMSGGDVGPLGEDAVNQLHGLFKWAATSKKGLLVFIDEADAFLSSRGTMGDIAGNGVNEDPHSRHALNALLYQTGTESLNFMLVLATNRPEDLDPAVLDRMDVSIKIDIPSEREREALVRLYINQHIISYLNNAKRNSWIGLVKSQESVDIDCLSETTIIEIANKCQDFSGREISKLFIAAQYSMILAPDKKLTLSLLQETVHLKIKEHNEKRGFMKKEAMTPAGRKLGKRLIPPPISSQHN